jgi:hypothetical protein
VFAIPFGLAVLVPWALVAAGLGEETPAGPPSITYGKPRQVATLANSRVSESSGLACGRQDRGVFWTHNDSGDSARVFAFTIRGEHVATYTIGGARAGGRRWGLFSWKVRVPGKSVTHPAYRRWLQRRRFPEPFLLAFLCPVEKSATCCKTRPYDEAGA